ncbi:MAG TPA: protoporphyrinogen oxidase [Bacteroidales bacterium]|nr:protoporphyrinogen oxidase [Bacteroidales bacterium]
MQKVDVTVVGAGLTGLTTAYYLNRSGMSVCLLEQRSETGGVIKTHNEQGFVFEAGPNTGVLSSTELVELFDNLNHRVKLETACSFAKARWVWKNRNWNALPSGLYSAVTTPLFSFWDKIRILGEPFRKPSDNQDETVSEMVKRRLGKSFLDYAVDPFISGIYAGDPESLSVRFALPKLYRLEQEYGSFIKGSIEKAKEPKTALQKRVTKEVFSVEGGLQRLVDALADEIGQKNVHTNCSSVAVEALADGFATTFVHSSGEQVRVYSDKVVSTIGGTGLDQLLPFLTSGEKNVLTSIPYAKVVQVVACFRSWQGIPLRAFGGLIPSKENRKVLGILFPSAIFQNRAPEGGAVLSVFMGGIKKPEFLEKSDEELKSIALSEIRETLKCSTTPELIRVFRYAHAIPQYQKEMEVRLQVIEDVQNRYPGLFVAGNLRDGIGMSDRVRQGRLLADRILEEKARGTI